jgi:hypothetical protein
VATDHDGNTTTKDIVLTIELPDITITDIEKDSETTATITAELSQDIDEGTVTFQKNRNGFRTNLFATDAQGKKIENYTLRPKLTTIQGQRYQLNEKI